MLLLAVEPPMLLSHRPTASGSYETSSMDPTAMAEGSPLGTVEDTELGSSEPTST